MGAAPDPDSDTLASFPSKRFRKPDTVSLLEHTRLRNIGMVFLMWYYDDIKVVSLCSKNK